MTVPVMTGDRLRDQDKLPVWKLLEQSEAARHTRAKFLAIVSDQLDRLRVDDALRQAVFAFARERADGSTKLAADRVELRAIEAARRTLTDCAGRLAAEPWHASVRDHWPATIAHEVERLFDEMQGRRLPSGERLEPSVDSALLQLKDAFEVLIKFTVTVLMRGLSDTGRDQADWARRQLFKGLSLGIWAGMLRESVKRATAGESSLPEPLKALARAASQAKLVDAAGRFASIRNDVIGHGAHALDPAETAELLVGCFETGRVRNLQGRLESIPPLAAVLKAMVERKAYDGMTLEARDGPARVDLSGAGAAETWLTDERHRHHEEAVMPVWLRFAENGTELPLAPFVAARICTQCKRRDVLLYDSLKEAKRQGTFDLLDYARGHKSRVGGKEATDLSDALGDLVPEEPVDLSGDSLNSSHVLEALDKARVDRNYHSPAYLRDDLADFLHTHDRGVFWLQAPAHVGKTTFVQGLTETEIGDAPIDPRFEGRRGGKLVAYPCRKEYRTGLAGMINTLQDKLQAAYDVSQNLRNEQPQPRPVLAAGTPEAFVNWLSDWRSFAERFGLTSPGAPLLVAIDGLDEADPPPGSTPLQVLPRPADLKEGIYLVLTSRPVGDADAPGFLTTDVETLYGRP
jgi:hypothetical protein